MEIKVYTIKLTPPRWLRNTIVYVVLPIAVLVGAVAVVRAGVTLTTFTANTPAKATDVNTNFTNLNDAVTALQAAVVPSGLIGMFATNCPTGWSACNGSGTCPNLVGAYPKGGTAFAAQTGGNAHVHTAGTYATSSAGDHAHVTYLVWDNTGIWANYAGTPVVWNPTHYAVFNLTPTMNANLQAAQGPLTTTAGAHSHSITGSSQSVSHEPVHATVVFCMKN